jgi:hypothetical protein
MTLQLNLQWRERSGNSWQSRRRFHFGRERQDLNTVPSKKKKSKFKVGTEARRRARLGIGLPPPERTITEKRLKKPKHKKKLEDLVVED